MRGTRPIIPAAGSNRRLCVYGALDYRTGGTPYMVHPKKNARQFGEFLRQLLEHASEHRLALVIDNASYHRTRAVLNLLEDHRDHVFVIWLPRYSPELNLIEGLWGYLKRTALNNYFFGDMDSLEQALHEVFAQLKQNPESALAIAYHPNTNLRKTA